jgi:protein-tyrosine phosphatase
MRVLFVCLGNICRSPLAEGVFRKTVERAGLEGQFEIDSAGTGGWHVGDPPDPRMQETAARHGIDISTLRARRFRASDFEEYDLILAMDRQNLHDILRMAMAGQRSRVKLFRAFDPDEAGSLDVPDPYYGGRDGFEDVFEIVSRTSNNLLSVLAGA